MEGGWADTPELPASGAFTSTNGRDEVAPTKARLERREEAQKRSTSQTPRKGQASREGSGHCGHSGSTRLATSGQEGRLPPSETILDRDSGGGGAQYLREGSSERRTQGTRTESRKQEDERSREGRKGGTGGCRVGRMD